MLIGIPIGLLVGYVIGIRQMENPKRLTVLVLSGIVGWVVILFAFN